MKRTIYLAVITLITIGCIIFGVSEYNDGDYFFAGGGNGKMEIEESATLNDFSAIKVDAAVMDLEVRTGSGYALDYRGTKNLVFNYQVEDNELVIQQTQKKKISANNGAVLVLTVPRDTTFETMNIKVDVGEIEIDGISMDSCESSVDVGEVEIKNSLFGLATIDTGTGDIKLNNCNFDSLEISADVGDVEVHSGQNLTGYAFDLKTDVGEVEINEDDYGRKYTATGENGTVIIKGDVGDIKVKY